MTEEEAKTKWCPETMAAPATYDTDGMGVREWGPFLCRGSACMAWRWSEAKRTVAFLEAVQAHMQTQAKPNFNTAVQAVWSETGGKFERVEGHCGLAGSPQ